jgi:hypothetical protein
MPEIIPEFSSKKGRPPKYQWDEWADGKSRRLYKDQDFACELISMRTMIHRQARLMGLRAYTHINEADQSIKVRFYSEE